jgi:ABC-type Fe3+-hydroxamate transport system substrate-binding protein
MILKTLSKKPSKKVAYFIWKSPYMVAGSDNFINELLKLNHFKNIYDNPETPGRYPEIELDKMKVEGDPEIVLSSEPFRLRKRMDMK